MGADATAEISDDWRTPRETGLLVERLPQTVSLSLYVNLRLCKVVGRSVVSHLGLLVTELEQAWRPMVE